ncbi:hypothetical protein I79_010302 [Cricetulus griseus]|uniref:Uncharacterized protein n=1 Tax=Cricetulus griseus TaxID=10029 RepID=G3HI37_CRIGR|nr:hypothetical protein I79_010302 [Cricetulus griseus]
MVTENLNINSKILVSATGQKIIASHFEAWYKRTLLMSAWAWHGNACAVQLCYTQAYQETSKFQVANRAYHHSATQECGPPGREARRCSPSPEGECQAGKASAWAGRSAARKPPAVPAVPRLRCPARRTARRTPMGRKSQRGGLAAPGQPDTPRRGRGRSDSPGSAPQGSCQATPRRPGSPGSLC